MLDQTSLKFYRFLSAILLVVMLSMSSVMYVSAHGGDVTLIHACVSKRGGTVRIVSPTATCDVSKETALDWGIQGSKGDKGDTGDVGPMGLQGPQGEQGPSGAGISRANTYTVSVSVDVPFGSVLSIVASCNDSNDVVLTGGYDYSAIYELEVNRSIPAPYFQNQAWVASVQNNSPSTVTITIYAMCLNVP